MNTVIVEKECGCFRKSSHENNVSFESKDDALMNATQMVQDMNTKFCGKHEFIARENGDNILISVEMPTAQSSGCCGGGHCS
jgi:hypothetical protein